MKQILLMIALVVFVAGGTGCQFCAQVLKGVAGNAGQIHRNIQPYPRYCNPINPPSAKFLETKTKAQAGDATAQSELGEMYGRGEEVEQSIKKAVKWFRLAADQGDEEARKNLQALLKEHSELREN